MFQLRVAFKKNSFYISFIINLLLSCIAFAQMCITYFGEELSTIPSAEKVFILAEGTETIGALVFNYLFPLCAVLPFADSYILEKEFNTLPLYIPKTGVKRFFAGKMIAVATSAFIVTVIPLLFNAFLCVCTFPLQVNDFWQLSNDQSFYYTSLRINNLFFPMLSIQHPYLINFLSIVLIGLFCAIMAAFVCQVSFFINQRIIVLALFFIVNHLLSLLSAFFSDGNFQCSVPLYNLILGNYEFGKQVWFLYSLFIIPIVCIVSLANPCIKRIIKIWG